MEEEEAAATTEPLAIAEVDSVAIQMDVEPFPAGDDRGPILAFSVGGGGGGGGGEADPEPYEGMEFDSEESARSFYSAYARRVGFRVRISRYIRSRRDNTIISRLMVCSKEGFRDSRRNGTHHQEEQHHRRHQRERAVTRVGCKAMLMVKKLAPGKWAVSKFVKDHNHGPVPPKKVEVKLVHGDDRSPAAAAAAADRPNFENIHEPFEGMEFDSEEDARSYYIDYAQQTGFRARISKYCRSRRDNSIISRQIVCSKEGFREVRVKKEEADDGRVKRPREVTRVGCKAMIIVKKLNTGRWVVSRFEREHNHVLASLKSTDDDCEKSLVTYEGGANLDSSEGVALGGGFCGGIQGTSRESLTVLYNQLCYEAIKYAKEGSVSEEIYNVAMSALKEASEKVVAAKRSVAATSQQGVNVSNESNQRHSSSELKKVVTGKELVLMQQPFQFVLIPSNLANDSMLANNVVDSPMILSISNGQEKNISARVSDLKRSSPTTQSAEELVLNGTSEHDGAVKRLKTTQKLDNTGGDHARTSPDSESNLITSTIFDKQMVAIPAPPVTFCMPVAGSLSESYSGTPGSNTYKLVSAPLETLSGFRLSAAALGSQSEISPQQTTTTTGADYQYTGPNPQVHATAIAAGARVVPPQEAASLIKAIEARVRTAKSALASGSKQPTPTGACSPQPCNSAEGQKALGGAQALSNASEGTLAEGQKALTVAQAHSNASEGTGALSSDDVMQFSRAVEGSSDIEVGMMSDSVANDNACEEHLFSDVGS